MNKILKDNESEVLVRDTSNLTQSKRADPEYVAEWQKYFDHCLSLFKEEELGEVNEHGGYVFEDGIELTECIMGEYKPKEDVIIRGHAKCECVNRGHAVTIEDCAFINKSEGVRKFHEGKKYQVLRNGQRQKLLIPGTRGVMEKIRFSILKQTHRFFSIVSSHRREILIELFRPTWTVDTPLENKPVSRKTKNIRKIISSKLFVKLESKIKPNLERRYNCDFRSLVVKSNLFTTGIFPVNPENQEFPVVRFNQYTNSKLKKFEKNQKM